MSQRNLLLASAAFTAIALVGAGVLIGRRPSSPSGTDRAALPPDREAAYRSLVAEANARIAAQQRVIDQTRTGSTQVVGDPAPAPAGQVEQKPIGPNAAALAALALAPGARLVGTPELVSFQGKPAYETVLDLGTVYVDAFAPRVLHDGTTKPSRAPKAHDDDDDDHDDEHGWLAKNDHERRRAHREHEEHDDD